MRPNTNFLTDGASREELIACAELLATSLAEQLTSTATFSMQKTMAQLQAGTDEFDVFPHSNKVLEEALEIVRIPSADTVDIQEARDSLERDKPIGERRKQFRIDVTTPVDLLYPKELTPVKAKLINISWGGAAIQVEQALVDADDTIQIFIPGSSGDTISVEARVLRRWDLPDGDGQGLATRFSSLRTRDEEELEKFLEYLALSGDSEGGGLRRHGRLTQRLDLQFGDSKEIHATLIDISAGGLGISVPDELEIGQSLLAVVSPLDESCSLNLRARVVRQEAVVHGQSKYYRVGLEFEHPTEELQERTKELIGQLVAASGDS